MLEAMDAMNDELVDEYAADRKRIDREYDAKLIGDKVREMEKEAGLVDAAVAGLGTGPSAEEDVAEFQDMVYNPPDDKKFEQNSIYMETESLNPDTLEALGINHVVSPLPYSGKNGSRVPTPNMQSAKQSKVQPPKTGKAKAQSKK